MAQDNYPLLPANLPGDTARPPDKAAAGPSGPPIELPPPDPEIDPELLAQITLLAANALPPRAGQRPFPPAPPASVTVAPPLRVVPTAAPPPRGRARSCLSVALVLLVVGSLLASSLFSLFWFWNQRAERVAEVRRLAEARAPVALPIDPEPREPGTAAQPPADPVNRIVFTNRSGGIETMAPDGSDRRALTDDDLSYQFPAWSPDGTAIAAVGGSLAGGGIYLLEDTAELAEPEEIFFSRSQSPFYLYWSPDSAQISFLASSRANGMELNLVPRAGGDSRVLALGSPMYWNWTPDSSSMLIHSGDAADDALIALIDDEGQVQPPALGTPGYFQAPGISTSGRYWAYSQVRAGDTNWLVIDDRRDDAQQATRHAGAVALSWSPARDEVAFISGDPDNQFATWGPLRLLDAATGAERMLSTDTVLAFFWSPDGSQIATISLPNRPLLGEQFEVRGGGGRQFVAYRPAAAPQPAQRGHTFRISVIDVASGEGRDLAERTLSPLFLAQFLPYFDQYALSHTLWSPASDALVLPVIDEGAGQIAVIDTRTGRVDNLAEGRIAFWSRQ